MKSSAVWRDAIPRVHHEGRLFVPYRSSLSGIDLLADARGLPTIFTRLGLDFRAVEADTGSIGGAHLTNFTCSLSQAKTRSPSQRAAITQPTSSWHRPWRAQLPVMNLLRSKNLQRLASPPSKRWRSNWISRRINPLKRCWPKMSQANWWHWSSG